MPEVYEYRNYPLVWHQNTKILIYGNEPATESYFYNTNVPDLKQILYHFKQKPPTAIFGRKWLDFKMIKLFSQTFHKIQGG